MSWKFVEAHFLLGCYPLLENCLGHFFIKLSTQFKLYRPAKISKSLKVWVQWKTRSTSKKGRRQNILPMLKRRLTQKRGWLGRSNVAEEVIEGWSAVSSDRWVNQCNAFHAVFIDRTPVFGHFLAQCFYVTFHFWDVKQGMQAATLILVLVMNNTKTTNWTS